MLYDVTKGVGLGGLEEAQSGCAALLEQGPIAVLGSVFEQPNLTVVDDRRGLLKYLN